MSEFMREALPIIFLTSRDEELDRILGWEAAYAGTSWLDLGQLGSLRFGSESRSPGCLCSAGGS